VEISRLRVLLVPFLSRIVSFLPQRSILARCQSPCNLRMMQLIIVSRRLGVCRFMRMHALKGNRLRVLVGIFARKRRLDLIERMTFRR
jgi:hypothetical protein